MHAKGYVVTVRQDGQTLKEESGKFAVCFNSEYQIRLRNKTRKRAVADVYIDGRKVVDGGIVVAANDYVDLERFVEGDLLHGNKFKFVPLQSEKVEDKGEPENGVIEVRFYPEKEEEIAPNPIIINTRNRHFCSVCYDRHYCSVCYGWHCYCHGCYWPFNYHRFNVTYTTNTGNTAIYTTGSDASAMSLQPDNLSQDSINDSNLEAGATVKGGESNQKFSSAQVDVDRSNPVIITVKIIPKQESYPIDGIVTIAKEKTFLQAIKSAIVEGELRGEIVRVGEVEKAVFEPAKRVENRFCPECGKGIGSTDKFCRYCGKGLQ